MAIVWFYISTKVSSPRWSSLIMLVMKRNRVINSDVDCLALGEKCSFITIKFTVKTYDVRS